jgi:hypothetical protein
MDSIPDSIVGSSCAVGSDADMDPIPDCVVEPPADGGGRGYRPPHRAAHHAQRTDDCKHKFTYGTPTGAFRIKVVFGF